MEGRGPTFCRTPKKASLKTPGLLYGCLPCARVELGWTQGRFLELVGQDSQEEFRVGEARTPADQTLLSVREGGIVQPVLTQASEEALSLPRTPRPQGENYSDHPPIPNLERHRKLVAAHSCQGP